jgi:hypothetical protein
MVHWSCQLKSVMRSATVFSNPHSFIFSKRGKRSKTYQSELFVEEFERSLTKNVLQKLLLNNITKVGINTPDNPRVKAGRLPRYRAECAGIIFLLAERSKLFPP